MDFPRDHYDTEGPLGIPMKDCQARALDALLKQLPQDDLHAPGKLTVEKATTELLAGERADVSWISTEDIDRYRDIVIAKGMNDEHFKLNPIVTLQHSYWMPPVGRSLWRKRVKDGDRAGIKAKTVYPTRPDSLPDGAPWLPDETFPLIQAGLLNGKSIGFIPTKARYATEKEEAQGIRRVVEEWILLEYACCYLPCNQQTVVEAVSKGLIISEAVRKALSIDLKDVERGAQSAEREEQYDFALRAPLSALSESVIPFTTVAEVRKLAFARIAGIDFPALGEKIFEAASHKVRGKV